MEETITGASLHSLGGFWFSYLLPAGWVHWFCSRWWVSQSRGKPYLTTVPIFLASPLKQYLSFTDPILTTVVPPTMCVPGVCHSSCPPLLARSPGLGVGLWPEPFHLHPSHAGFSNLEMHTSSAITKLSAQEKQNWPNGNKQTKKQNSSGGPRKWNQHTE